MCILKWNLFSVRERLSHEGCSLVEAELPAWAQVKSHLMKWPPVILLVSHFFRRD